MKMQLCVKVSHGYLKKTLGNLILSEVTVDKSKDRTRALKLDEDEFLEVNDTLIVLCYMYFCFFSLLNCH